MGFAKNMETLVKTVGRGEDNIAALAKQESGKKQESDSSFSRILAEESSSSAAKENVNSKDKKEAKKEAKTREATKKLLEAKLSGSVTELSPMYQFLYNLVYKDPSTLTLAERQLVYPSLINNAGKPVKCDTIKGLGINEFQKLLSTYSVKVSDLSFTQIAELARMDSKAEVHGFLERLRLEMRKADTGKETELVEEESGNLKKQKKVEINAAEVMLGQLSAGLAGLNGQSQSEKTSKTYEVKQSSGISDEEFVKQVLDRIADKKLDELSRIVINLHPEHLGDLHLTIEMDQEQQHLSAQFKAESKRAKGLIESNIGELKEALSSKGIALGKISVA